MVKLNFTFEMIKFHLFGMCYRFEVPNLILLIRDLDTFIINQLFIQQIYFPEHQLIVLTFCQFEFKY